jgi:hypothetical protein
LIVWGHWVFRGDFVFFLARILSGAPPVDEKAGMSISPFCELKYYQRPRAKGIHLSNSDRG